MTMVKHTNFYENLTEAQTRLRGTIVAYDHEGREGVEPYYVFAITNHRKDGVFRIYLERLDQEERRRSTGLYYPETDNYTHEDPQVGLLIDKWMEVEKNKDFLIRKKMDSKYFNNFRPFPLGMCNLGGKDGRCFYLERQPQRHREQGLTNAMVVENRVTLGATVDPYRGARREVAFKTPAFRSCVRGEYPSVTEVLSELKDPKNGNEAVAFHRHFAVVKGPMDLLFLGYKDKIVGILPNSDTTEVRLGKNFQHTREAVEELRVFDRIIQK
jgi:hypothetical protein